MNKSTLAALPLSLALCGCAPLSLNGDGPSTRGLNKNHTIIVTVHNGMIEVDVPELHIRGEDHKIMWELDQKDNQDLKFTADGIRFTTLNGGDKAFKPADCNPIGANRKYMCKGGKSAAPGANKYEYIIKLQGDLTVDPFVVNN